MDVKADLLSVLAMMDCPSHSPMRAELTDMFYNLQPHLQGLCKIGAKYSLGQLPFDGINPLLKKGDPVIFSIITMGPQLADFIRKEFEMGNHLQALLADAMASSMLFSYQTKVAEELASFAQKEGYGIEGVFEAPSDIDAAIIDYIVKITGADKDLGLSLTAGHMLVPEKSMCQIYLLSRDTSKCNYEHDCSTCQAENCKFKQ